MLTLWRRIRAKFGNGITIGAAFGLFLVCIALVWTNIDLDQDIREVRPCTDFGPTNVACQESAAVVIEACQLYEPCRTNLAEFVRRKSQP